MQKRFLICFLILLMFTGVAGASASALDLIAAQGNGVLVNTVVLPTWEQVNSSSGFGDPSAGQAPEVSALAVYKGYLYAGTHNPIDPAPLFDGAQIFRSPDGVAWAAVTIPGFENGHDTAPPAILDLTVFKEYLYASTGRGNASQIWRTSNGVNWANVVPAGFADPNNVNITVLAEFAGKLYAGVNNSDSGAQIWSSFSGDSNSWTLAVSSAAPQVPPASITGMAVYGGALYAAVAFESDAPVQIWRTYGSTWETVINDGFGDSDNMTTGGMAAYGGDLYVGGGNATSGAKLWHSSDGDNWFSVGSPGFVHANNLKVEMVSVYQNQLYVSVQNSVSGMEVWRSTDGSNWEQANQGGFGDAGNSGTNWSNATVEHLCYLYVGTANTAGGELWRMQEQPCSKTFLPLVWR